MRHPVPSDDLRLKAYACRVESRSRIGYLLFREGPVAESDEIREGIIIDYDREGRVVSLEILKASEQVSDPKAIAYELKSAKAAPL